MASTDLLPAPALHPHVAAKLADEKSRLEAERLPANVIAARLGEHRTRLETELAATLAAARLNLTDEIDRFDCCGDTPDVLEAVSASLLKRLDGDPIAAGLSFVANLLVGSTEPRVGVTVRRVNDPGGWTLQVNIGHYSSGG